MNEQRKQELLDTLRQKLNTDSEQLDIVVTKAENLFKDVQQNSMYDDNLSQKHEEELIDLVAKAHYLNQRIKMHNAGIAYAQSKPADQLYREAIVRAMIPNDFIRPQ